MAEIISFRDYEEAPDWKRMSWADLQEYLDAVRQQIAMMDEKEPRNMNSKAFEEWADRHEDLEDLEDEILDRLDEMGGPDA